MRRLRLALAQLNLTVGDLEGNTRRIAETLAAARAQGAEVVAFPELAITGYPPEDLLLKPQFIADNRRCLEELLPATEGLTAIVGFVDACGDLYNAAAVLHDGALAGVYHKVFLPNYGVFDENRYFRRGTACPIYVRNGIRLGINICEDIWHPDGPAAWQAAADAEVIININASPYHRGKRHMRHQMVATRAIDNTAIVAYLNLVGGQDELVFDGGSFVYDQQGRLVAEAEQFAEALLLVDLDVEAVFRTRLHDPRRRQVDFLAGAHPPVTVVPLRDLPSPPQPPLSPALPPRIYDAVGEVYAALVLGTRDYVRKNGFKGVVIGLSGGIDSSLVATIAVDALGAENVVGVSMPSRYSSTGSREDAAALAANLGIRYLTIPIEEAFTAYLHMLAGAFEGTQPDVTEENLQARIRGNILMALSNKFGWLVLTTGNKSEMATGYATLYGDMAGGFAVIKDVPKTLVYALARYRNAQGPAPVIPESVLTKEPSAELRPGQRDVDSLPPYEVLDPILEAYVEQDCSYDELLARGFDPATVRRVITLVDRSEYKRRQAPPGVKITPRAFGRDRRLPIVNRYRAF
jgi:NAD+ synthase (glutamine-hydrolysing)